MLSDKKFTPEERQALYKIPVYIHGYRLEKTCYACPEQYDVYEPSGKMVAYIRLRHGHLRVDCPDVGNTIYSTDRVHGDGMFDDDERFKKLNECIEKMIEWYLNTPWEEQESWNNPFDYKNFGVTDHYNR